MRKACIRTALLHIGMLAWCATGATLFQDDFSNATASRAQWGDSSNLKPVFANGSMYVGSRVGYPVIINHSLACSTFTYSVRIKSLKAGAVPLPGIVFCGGMRAKTGGSYYGGYAFTFSPGQTYGISKMLSNGSVPTLYAAYNSYISDVENVLTVSKAGTHLVFFCNGAFLTGIVDSTFSKGEIGLFLYTGDSIQVDDVLVTDNFRAGADVKNFHDPFANPSLTGWNLWVNGWQNKAEAVVSGGVLTFASEPAGMTVIYTDGAFTDAPVKVAARFNTGDTTSFYGLMLLRFNRTFTSQQVGIAPAGQSGFVISGKRDWGFFSDGQWLPQKSAAIHGNGAWDTMEVRINASKGLDFYVNGTSLGTYNETRYDYNAVGLYVDIGVTAQFDDFAAGDSAVNVGVRRGWERRNLSVTSRSTSGKPRMLFDLAGRSVSRAGLPGCYLLRGSEITKRVVIQ